MKRKIIITLVVLTCLAGLCAMWWHSDPAVHWTEVETKFQGRFGRSDSGQSHDRTWIPSSVRNHPRRRYLEWKRNRGIRLAIGFPNMDMGFHDHVGGQHTVLSVHLYENLARGITISHEPDARSRAEEIQGTLREMFPQLPTRIEERNAQPEDRQVFSEAAPSASPEKPSS